jgi:hypothetical protein
MEGQVMHHDSESDAQPRRTFTWRTSYFVLIGVVFALGLIAVLGGFHQRADSQINVDPGSLINNSMADVRVVKATARESWEPGTWEISVMAEVSNTSDYPFTTESLSNVTAMVYHDAQGQQQDAQVVIYLTADLDTINRSPRQVIPPNSGPMSVCFQAQVNQPVQWSQGIKFGVFPAVRDRAAILNLSDSSSWERDPSTTSYWLYVIIPELIDSD